jgi:hypothetical protein
MAFVGIFFYSGGDGGSVDSSSSLNSLRKLHILSLESASQPRFNIHGIIKKNTDKSHNITTHIFDAP